MPHGGASLKATSNVVVAIRTRPLSKNEVADGCGCTVEMTENSCILSHENVGDRTFSFDRCFWSTNSGDSHFASQECLFEELCLPLLENAWEGYNCAMFAYGQTGNPPKKTKCECC